MTTLYSRLQQAIEALYRIEGPARVDDFRINERQLDEVMGLGKRASDREMLLVSHDGEHTDVALFVSEEVARSAEAFLVALEPEQRDKLIDGFCAALEGVSHFVYFTYCGAALDRPVSKIELELQAEVDKFLLLRLLFPVPELIERLFARFDLHPNLAAEDQERYHVANQRARRYALWLDRTMARGQVNEALHDARQLYRKPLAFKLDHIARAA